jgi:hypothetical protein
MTTRPERFRVKALECYVAAQNYLELMQNWRDLARHGI